MSLDSILQQYSPQEDERRIIADERRIIALVVDAENSSTRDLFGCQGRFSIVPKADSFSMADGRLGLTYQPTPQDTPHPNKRNRKGRTSWIRDHLGTRDLEMQNERLTISDVAVIAELSGTVEKLVLVNNDIGDEGAIMLSKNLKTNRRLQELIIYGNQIGNRGAIALSQAVKENHTIQTLSLPHNNIGDEGTLAFVDLLQHNSTLRCLNLAGNVICDEGAAALSEMLKENRTLQKLVLDRNRIGDEGAVALRKSLLENTSLCELGFKNNRINLGVCRTLSEVLWMDPTQRLWRAAEQGCPGSQFRLGCMLDLRGEGLLDVEGEGLVQNTSKAAHWFLLSAQQGDVRSQLQLGLMYDKGRGVDQNKRVALEWFQAAAVQGRVDGIFECLRRNDIVIS